MNKLAETDPPVSAWMPWLDPDWSRWRERLENDRLPHAVLLEGPAGTGKRAFARRLCRAFLCTAERGTRPCGECASCRWTAAGTHPDFHVLSPEESRDLTVGQVRELGARLMLSGTRERRAAILDPADALNRSSANAFLKTLEEPPPGVLLVLVAEYPSRLPATILSRCQREALPLPEAAEARAWLAEAAGSGDDDMREALWLAGGAAGEALRLLRGDALAERRAVIADLETLAGRGADYVAVAERWQKLELEDLLAWLARWLALAIRGAAGRERDKGSPLRHLLSGVDWQGVFELYDQVNAARRDLDTQLRRDLLLETLLIRWCRLTGGNGEPVT